MGSWIAGRRVIRALALTMVAVVWSFAAAAQEACRMDTVQIRGDWGSARFSVEIADTHATRAVGLMHRTSMPMGSGMLFIYPRPQPLSFWMRNTLIPLDMIFIDARGVVRHVHHEAIPLDETPIHGGPDLTSVLEINGGLARRMGIAPGSVVRHPSFAGADPAWPC